MGSSLRTNELMCSGRGPASSQLPIEGDQRQQDVWRIIEANGGGGAMSGCPHNVQFLLDMVYNARETVVCNRDTDGSHEESVYGTWRNKGTGLGH